MYDLLYYEKEKQPLPAYSFFYFSIFLSLQFSNITLFLGIVRPIKLKSHLHNGSGSIYCVYQNKASSAYFVTLFIFFYFQLANINIFCLLNWCNISPMATTVDICELVLTVCYIMNMLQPDWNFVVFSIDNKQISVSSYIGSLSLCYVP